MNQKALKNLLRERTPEAWLVAADMQEDLGDPEGAHRTRETAKIVGHLLPILRDRVPDIGYTWHDVPGTNFEVRLGGRTTTLTVQVYERRRDPGSPQHYEFRRRLTQHLSWTSIRCTPGHLFKRLLEVADVILGEGQR